MHHSAFTYVRLWSQTHQSQRRLFHVVIDQKLSEVFDDTLSVFSALCHIVHVGISC